MSPSECNSLRVLIADDSDAVRQRLCELLQENRSIRVVGQAASAGEAWALFERERPAAVVLDLQLPDGNGLDLLSRIKQIRPDCLVLILTNHSEPVFQEECRRRGADHFLHKSLEFERVSELLSPPAWATLARRVRAQTQRIPLALAAKKTAVLRLVASPAAASDLSSPPSHLQPATP